MTDFEGQLYKLCIAEVGRARTADAKATVAHVVASALAATIAASTGGDPTAASILTAIFTEELPGMVDRRIVAIREARAAAQTIARPQ